MIRTLRFLGALLLSAWLTGCVSSPNLSHQRGESLVFIGEEPAVLAYAPASGHRISVRNSYLPFPSGLQFIEGRDYLLDRKAGTLWRTPESRIPDFRTNNLYGQVEFDHTRFPGFGNSGFFAFVDYSFAKTKPWPVQTSQVQFLRGTQAKLKKGGPIKIVAFGDSITAGGDASKPELIFWRRWVADLQDMNPQAQITAVNGATGGDSTVQGLQRLKAKVLDEKPDLVLIGFGMNDHNVNGVPIPNFEQNLKEMIGKIREASAEVILFSAFPPNPKWKFGSHRMEEYAAATERTARDTQCAYADVFSNWQAIAARKKPEDLLGNNINHPNDFGHWIYFAVLLELGLR